MAPRLRERYDSEIQAQLQQRLEIGNVMDVPRLDKIVVNMGVGDAAEDAKLIDGAMTDLSVIAGQKPKLNRARRSIANFFSVAWTKLRALGRILSTGSLVWSPMLPIMSR